MRSATSLARSLFVSLVSIILLLWVALYNGYPTVFPDTASYIYSGAVLKPVWPFRAQGYGRFVILTSLGMSTWFTAVAQAILVVIVMRQLLKYLIGSDSKLLDDCLLGVAVVLAALTSLPWVTSLLMPDFFAGIVFLSLFLLAFDGDLKSHERAVRVAIAAVGIASHLSLLPIALLFVAALLISRAAGWAPQGAPAAGTILAWLVLPLLLSVLWTASLNRQMGLGFRISGSGNEFFLGRLLGDGLAADFLRESCPKARYVACRYVDSLPRTPEQFLFWNPMLHEMSGDEIRAIIIGTLKMYPVRFAWLSARHTLRQTIQMKTGDEVRDLALHAVNANGPVIAEIFPNDLRAYSNSKLIQGRLVGFTKVVAGIDLAAFWVSLVACVVPAWKHRATAQKWTWFFYSTIVFLFLNAAVCATLAGVYDRYQSRVAWLMPLCLAAFLCRPADARDSEPQ
jgi:hypothetical protein